MVNDANTIQLKELATLFGCSLSAVEQTLLRYSDGSSEIRRGRLWELVVLGATVDTLVDQKAYDWFVQSDRKPRMIVSACQKRRIMERDGHRCRYCGKKLLPAEAVVDHVLPWCQGGRNDDYNLVAACRSCNRKKGSKTPEEAGMPIRDAVPTRENMTRRKWSKSKLLGDIP